MVYLVCEDSSSGYTFWTHALHIFTKREIVPFVEGMIHNDNTVLYAVSSNGNKGLSDYVESLNLTSNDTLILVYDNIVSNTELLQNINEIRAIVKSSGCNFYYSNYFCLEEVLLSYIKLLDVLNLPHKERPKIQLFETIVKEWQVQIYSGMAVDIAFVNILNNHSSELKSSNVTLGSTEESMFASFLSQITSLSKYPRQVRKDKIGDCWIKDCSCITDSYTCRNCILELLKPTARDKFIDLDENSILSYPKTNDSKTFEDLENKLGV